MKMPTSLPRSICVLLGIAAVLLLAGCRNPFVRSHTPVSPGTAPSSVTAPEGEAAAEHTVEAYLTALREGRYAAAYDMLSKASQGLHSRADFEQTGKKGMPHYDLTTVHAVITGDSAVVGVRLEEDPASHGFHLVRESGAWKFVYRGGIPGSPDP